MSKATPFLNSGSLKYILTVWRIKVKMLCTLSAKKELKNTDFNVILPVLFTAYISFWEEDTYVHNSAPGQNQNILTLNSEGL